MSAIDLYVKVDKVKGSHGEDRVLLTFNGKVSAVVMSFRAASASPSLPPP